MARKKAAKKGAKKKAASKTSTRKRTKKKSTKKKTPKASRARASAGLSDSQIKLVKELSAAVAAEHAAAIKSLVEENARTVKLVVEQNAHALQAIAESTERFRLTLDSFAARIEALEASLQAIDEKLATLVRRGEAAGEAAVIAEAPTLAPAEMPPTAPLVVPSRIRERTASSLADLLAIRAANQPYLDAINGTLGTALGFKTTAGIFTDEPAIIVFVPQKVHPDWAPEIADRLFAEIADKHGKTRISCSIDFEEGKKPTSLPSHQEIDDDITRALRGGSPMLRPGSQLAALNPACQEMIGTLGIFVGERSSRAAGFLSNDHVAFPNTKIFHPRHPSMGPGKRIGLEPSTNTDNRCRIKAMNPQDWYGPFAMEPDAEVHVDCEFIKLDPLSDRDSLTNDLLTQGGLGELFTINLHDPLGSMSCALGKQVMKLGRTTGLTRGIVTAFAYEWHDDSKTKRYTDLLIKPLDINQPFSQAGDSGSLVVVEANRRPLALLWGGLLEQLETGAAQTNWTYATRLSAILSHLDLTIFRPDSP